MFVDGAIFWWTVGELNLQSRQEGQPLSIVLFYVSLP